MSKRKRVVPAILTDDSAKLEKMVRQAETFTSYVQIDIMDGQFVPSRSIGWKEIDDLSINLEWDAHLMVLNSEECIASFHRAGAQRITFHYEATENPQKIITQIKELGLEVGIAINPETPVSAITTLADKVDTVLFLSVHPGFYGSEFIPEVLDKIREFRILNPDLEIGLDGGVKESNIAEVARSGANSIYVGSAIFLQECPGESFRYLTSLIQDG